MKSLIVIDMQEDYVGDQRNKKRYCYDTKQLISNINERIKDYPLENVVYITNKFFWEFNKSPKILVSGLKVVSTKIFEKRANSAFSNKDFISYLEKENIDEVELVGVDGNFCVAATALDGCKKNYSVICNESCIGASDRKKFEKVKEILLKKGVKFL